MASVRRSDGMAHCGRSARSVSNILEMGLAPRGGGHSPRIELWVLHLRDAEAIDLYFEMVIDSNAVDPIGLPAKASSRQGSNDRAVHDEIHLVGLHTNFEGVGGSSAAVRFFHGRAGGFRRHFFSGHTRSQFDEVSPVICHHKIQIAL